MPRSLYVAGGLITLFLVVLAQPVTLVPASHLSPVTPAATASEAPDPAATAIDDLAAWPGVARP